MSHQHIHVQLPALLARQNAQASQVERTGRLVSTLERVANLVGQLLAAASLKFGRCIRRAVDEELDVTLVEALRSWHIDFRLHSHQYVGVGQTKARRSTGVADDARLEFHGPIAAAAATVHAEVLL